MNLPLCPFCRERAADLLCDGELPDGRICSLPVCLFCATSKVVGHVRLTRRINGSRDRLLSVDLCPACRAANREGKLFGLSDAEARALVAKRAGASGKPPQGAFDFEG